MILRIYNAIINFFNGQIIRNRIQAGRFLFLLIFAGSLVLGDSFLFQFLGLLRLFSAIFFYGLPFFMPQFLLYLIVFYLIKLSRKILLTGTQLFLP